MSSYIEGMACNIPYLVRLKVAAYLHVLVRNITGDNKWKVHGESTRERCVANKRFDEGRRSVRIAVQPAIASKELDLGDATDDRNTHCFLLQSLPYSDCRSKDNAIVST